MEGRGDDPLRPPGGDTPRIGSASPATVSEYSSCYNWAVSRTLSEIARHTDFVIARSRAELEHAVRQAYREGMSQARIAQETGRSQPEVSRLIHFHGTSPLARRLRANAKQVTQIIGESGGRDVRVFGSLATAHDTPDSDVDLLFTMDRPLSLMQISALENRIATLLGSKVDLVPESALRPDLRERIVSEAIPL